jgi:hypothetical protein
MKSDKFPIRIAKEAMGRADEAIYMQEKVETRKVASRAFLQAVERVISGRRSLEEWCEVVSGPVDDAVARTVTEDGLKFVGGYLSFSIAGLTANKVTIAYELYFGDEQRNWVKQYAYSDVYARNFSHEALEEISCTGSVKFRVEG